MKTKTQNTAPDHMKNVALRAYADQNNKQLEQQRIVDFLPMIPRIVQKVITYLKPPLSFEDLVSAGTVGLVKAAQNYDPSHKADFKTYAYIRVKGAVLDELRRWSFIPAGVNKQINQAMEITRQIIEKTGHIPTNKKLAEKLNISEHQLNKIFENSRAQHFLSIDASNQQDQDCSLVSILSAQSSTPLQQYEKHERIERLTKAIQQLPKRQREIIILYYHKQLTMKQIAEVFEITESRVSQLHANAVFNLSVKLKE